MSLEILYQPLNLGALKLKNTFVVAPLTRCRANPNDGIPNELFEEYYSMRSSFGMIITECSQIATNSNCFPGSGGIYSDEQVLGWKKVVDAVHAKGGLIVLQIWHCGRAIASKYIHDKPAVSSSDKAIPISDSALGEENSTPQRLTKEGIKEIIEEFRQGAINAKNAGFDGLELHGANGYLIDQFLRDGVNDRTDEYGGSVENRSRFCLEVMDVLIDVFGADRVGIRLSPTGRVNSMYDSDPIKLLSYLLPELDKKNIAFLEIKRHSMNAFEKFGDGEKQISSDIYFHTMRKYFKGNIIANDGITVEEMKDLINSKVVNAASFGTLSITNPDLPERILNGWELNKTVDFSTWLSQGAKGYTDYLPFHKI